jgi:cysteinyl-tRNA synthetase
MKLYNTLTRKKEEFKPIKEGEVLFYQCGPTVYSAQHIGNLRASVLADIICRVFIYNGYEVKFARNYTDVGHLVSDGDEGEDKMGKGAKKEGLSPTQIADKYIKIYEDDNKDLNNLVPTYRPRATEYINEMQAMVQVLLDKGFAYTTSLAIYFDISKVKDYTKLSGQILEENRDGAGTGNVEDPEKRNSADFAIWFFRAGVHKNAIQFWPSPFTSPLVENGNGFPGWHIECSAMSRALLGNTLDVHMGGVEHIPVHHTNEIAQSESTNGVSLANYWLHNEHLMVNSGKMSKSDGTGYLLAEVKEKACPTASCGRGFNSLALRYFYLQAHYRSKQNFTWESMQSAQNGYDRLLNNIKNLGKDIGKIDTEYKKKFTDSLSDDFNTPQALAIMQELLKSSIPNEDKLATVLDFDRVLGLNLSLALDENKKVVIIPEQVKEVIKKREEARKNKDWKMSDELRDQILALGYEIKDTNSGQEISKK